MEFNLAKKFLERRRELEKKKEEMEMLQSIKDAHREWLSKEEYFNFALDNELVDYAIYDAEASKRKYIYLLNKLKKEKNM